LDLQSSESRIDDYQKQVHELQRQLEQEEAIRAALEEGRNDAQVESLKEKLKSKEQHYADQMEKVTASHYLVLDQRDEKEQQLQVQLNRLKAALEGCNLEEVEGLTTADIRDIGAIKGGACSAELESVRKQCDALQQQLDMVTAAKDDAQNRLRQVMQGLEGNDSGNLATSLARQIEDLQQNMQEKEETFRKQILATVGDLEHAKHLARERSGYDAIATKATTLERQLHDTREELEKAEAIAEDQRCLYNEIKKLYLFNEQRNCSEVAVLQAAIRAKAQLAEDALAKMDEAVEELEMTHSVLLKNSGGDSERMFINKIKRLREQIAERDEVIHNLQGALECY